MSEPTTGYCDCACRDCFRGPIIGVAGLTMCDECSEAGCELDAECQAPEEVDDGEPVDSGLSGDPVQDVITAMAEVSGVAGQLRSDLDRLHTAFTVALNTTEPSGVVLGDGFLKLGAECAGVASTLTAVLTTLVERLVVVRTTQED